MEELLKNLGVKSVNDMSLEEIKTRIDVYQDFNDSLIEISEALEINTGTYMQLRYLYDEYEEEINRSYNARWEYDLDYYERNPRLLANILLAMVMNAHAKIGEISFMLENDLDGLEYRETEILEEMEQYQNVGDKI